MILVTGATGDIGGQVVQKLVQAGEKVRALARDPAKAAGKLGAGVEVVRGDLLQPETLAEAFAGATKVFLMAGAQDLPKVAEHATAEAKRAGVRHVVLLSSSTILIKPEVLIGKWHLSAEQQLEATGIAWTMVRPGNFASNTLRWAPTIKAQGTVFSPAGGKSAPIDPHDIAAVAAKALSGQGHEGKKYVLTGSELMSVAEQVEILGAALGKKLRLVEVPDEGARAGMLRAGMNEEMAGAILEVQVHGRSSGGGGLRTETVREVTGVEPGTFAAWAEAHRHAFA